MPLAENFVRMGVTTIVVGNCGASASNIGKLFRDIETIDQFEAAVERFRIAAMWLYGNFKFAHRALGTCSEQEFTRLIQSTEPRVPEADRQAFTEIEDIPD